MTEKRPYSSPEIASLGDAAEITEGISSPVAEGYAGSGRWYDASAESADAPDSGGDAGGGSGDGGSGGDGGSDGGGD